MLYKLNFQGYWRINKTDVAEYPGIYCVYDSSYGNLTDILYIGGTSRTINARMSEHADDDDGILEWVWKAEGRPLYFSAAKFESNSDIERLEAAMIYQHKPSCNDQLKHHFSYPKTEVLTSGKNHNLSPYFMV